MLLIKSHKKIASVEVQVEADGKNATSLIFARTLTGVNEVVLLFLNNPLHTGLVPLFGF